MSKRSDSKIETARKFTLAKTALRNAEVRFISYADRKQINVVTETKHNGKNKVWNYWAASDKFYCSNTGEKGLELQNFIVKVSRENLMVKIPAILDDRTTVTSKLRSSKEQRKIMEAGVTTRRRTFFGWLGDTIKSWF